MKFGKAHTIDASALQLPPDSPETARILQRSDRTEQPRLYVGFPTWNKAKLPGLYPKGTKDELSYYATQFNAIELNASFYRIFPKAQFETWRNRTPEGFMFFPKVVQNISHWKRLKDTEALVDEMIYAIEGLEHKLSRVFLQMPNNFAPKDLDRVVHFITRWPKHIPLAMELRHIGWHSDEVIAQDLYQLLEAHAVSNIITDTAGRRDLLHMRLTTPSVFVRFTAADHPIDHQRLDEWVERLATWTELGLQEIDFFIHQNADTEDPQLASYFIEKMNCRAGFDLKTPAIISKT